MDKPTRTHLHHMERPAIEPEANVPTPETTMNLLNVALRDAG